MRCLLPGVLATMLLSGPLCAREKIKLMYLETDQEVRAAVLINRLEVPLEVHRVGIFRVGKSLYGVVRFGAADDASGAVANQHRIGATTAILADRIFGEMPDLVRIDFEGVSFRETKEKKPEVLFSSSISRNTWKTIPKNLVPLQRVQMAGTLFFDPRVEPGEPELPQARPKPGKSPEKAAKTREKTRRSESK